MSPLKIHGLVGGTAQLRCGRWVLFLEQPKGIYSRAGGRKRPLRVVPLERPWSKAATITCLGCKRMMNG